MLSRLRQLRNPLLLVSLGAGLLLILGYSNDKSPEVDALAEVSRGDLLVKSVYHCQIEARNEVTILSRYKGFATVIELAREGSNVRPGELLARFDSAELELDMLRLEEEFALARSEQESLLKAQLPLEIAELEMQKSKLADGVIAERQYLTDSIALAGDNVVSGYEVDQQKAKVAQLAAELGAIEQRLELTIKFIHPSVSQRAEAKLQAARQALEMAQQQFENMTVYAPSGGMLVYKPLHIAGEYRTLRIGDNLHANQPFLLVTDLGDLIAHCMVPESELSRVAIGQEAFIVPRAYSDLELKGAVEQVGVVAETVPGQPAWQRFFNLRISIDDKDERLRPAMSVVTYVISEHKQNVVLVPRRAVSRGDEKPRVRVKSALGERMRDITTGSRNESHFEVIAGLEPGEWIILD